MASKAPAFQFYPRDWLSSCRVAEMGAANAGIYVWLLARQADNGALPADPDAVRDLLPAAYLPDWPGFIAPREGDRLGEALGWLSSAFPKLNARHRSNRRLGEVLGAREAYTEAAKKGGQATAMAWISYKAGLGPKPRQNDGPASASASAVQKSLRSLPEAPPQPPQGVPGISYRPGERRYLTADELDRIAGIPVADDPPLDDSDAPPADELPPPDTEPW